MPIYNKEKYLKRSIVSIQKQTFKNLEIIAINDCSTDKTLNILKNLSQKDSRIKIINNNKNRGLLFSRAMGILNSKGEYLMNLDPDDELQGSNNLKFLYYKIRRYKVDMISFTILYLPDKIKFGHSKNINRIINQPELFKSAFKNNYLNDFFITNKIISKKLLQKAFNIYKQKIYGNKWNYHDDNIWSILVHKYANSSINIKKVIYYYYKNNDSLCVNRNIQLEMENLFYRYDMFKEIFKSNEEQKYYKGIFNELIDFYKKNIKIIKKNEKLKKHFLTILKKYSNNL